MDPQLAFLARFAVELSAIYLGAMFVVGVAQRSIDPDHLDRWLKPRRMGRGMLVAAGLGAIVPFCSCSTVPLVAAMARSGVAVPVLTTFLVMSPLVNPATIALIATVTTPTVGAVYLLGSLFVALVAGAVLGRWKWPAFDATAYASTPLRREPWPERLRGASHEALTSYRRFLPVLALAAVLGAVLYGQTGEAWLRGLLSGKEWWLVPVAAIVGVPVYASTAVLLPLGLAVHAAGASVGVVMALLMGATGLSLPEGLMLRKLVGTRYVVTLAVVFVAGVVMVGYAADGILGLMGQA